MPDKKVAPYGAWKSPITSDLIVAETIGLREVALDGPDTYWLEQRPTEGGRYVVVRRTPNGRASDVTPAGYNARTTVHEYGGGSYLAAGGVVYFSNFEDQRLYRQRLDGSEPKPLTPAADIRYADGVMDAKRGRIICVREDHRGAGEAVNTIVSLGAAQGGEGEVLVAGADFYSNPRINSHDSKLAWLAWNHPNMPWDGTELWIADVQEDGALNDARLVAGGPNESIFQPEWSPDGSLYFVSDRAGWWNLYRWKDDEIQSLWETESEFGLPQWVFGARTYALLPDGRLICSSDEDGSSKLAVLEANTGQRQDIETPYTYINGIQAADGKAVFLGASAMDPVAVVALDFETSGI